MLRIFAALVFVVAASAAHAGQQQPRTMMDCFEEAGKMYKIPPMLLWKGSSRGSKVINELLHTLSI